LSRHKRSVMRKKLSLLKENVVKSSTPVVAEAKRTRKSEVEVAENEIKAMGLENHCSVLQF